jgi:hypothetical protein
MKTERESNHNNRREKKRKELTEKSARHRNKTKNKTRKMKIIISEKKIIDLNIDKMLQTKLFIHHRQQRQQVQWVVRLKLNQ